MTCRIIALGALLAFAGCSRAPAASVSFVNFDEAQTAIAYDALEHWCDAVGWCPPVVLDGELHVRLEPDAQYARNGRPDGSAGFNRGSVPLSPTGHTVALNADTLGNWLEASPSGAWVIVAHELGHEGADHAELGLMSARYPMAHACVDDWAVAAWCKRTGCHQDAAGTCTPDVEAEVAAAQAAEAGRAAQGNGAQ